VNVLFIILAILLGGISAFSASSKLRKDPKLVAQLTGLGVSQSQIPLLATLELLGALGLLVGIFVQPIGVAAAVGLFLYFVGAVIAHLLAKDSIKVALAPLVIAIVALVVTILELKR